MIKWITKIKDYIKEQTDSFFLLSVLFFAFIGISCSLFKFSSLNSYCFYVVFIFILSWLFYKFVKGIIDYRKGELDIKKTIGFILLVCAAFIGLFNIIIQTPISFYSFSYFRKFIITFTIYSFIYLLLFGLFDKRIKYLFSFSILCLGALSVLSFVSGVGRVYANQTTKNLLIFTFSNSNAAGIIFATFLVGTVFGFFVFKKWYLKALFILCAIPFVIFVYMTKSRNAIFALIGSGCLFILLRYFSVSVQRNRLLPIVVIVVVLPLFVSSLYVFLTTKTSFLETLNELFSTKGKETTSRDLTWVTGFKHLNGIHFLIGDYFDATKSSIGMMSGFQNGSLDIVVEWGIVPFVLLSSLVIYGVMNKFKIERLRLNLFNLIVLCLWGFTIFTSIFETGLFFSMGSIFVYGFIYLAFFDSDKRYPHADNDCLKVIEEVEV